MYTSDVVYGAGWADLEYFSQAASSRQELTSLLFLMQDDVTGTRHYALSITCTVYNIYIIQYIYIVYSMPLEALRRLLRVTQILTVLFLCHLLPPPPQSHTHKVTHNNLPDAFVCLCS